MYQAVLAARVFPDNYFVVFEIAVEEFQCSSDSCPVIESNNDNTIGIICLAIYGGVMTVLLVLLSCKHFKNKSFQKSKGTYLNKYDSFWKVLMTFSCYLF